MKNNRQLITVIVEASMFGLLGLLLVRIAVDGMSRYFVVHRLTPFIAGTGFLFLLWSLQDVYVLCGFGYPPGNGFSGSAGFLPLAVFCMVAVLVEVSVFSKRNTTAWISPAEYTNLQPVTGTVTEDGVKSLIKKYPDSRIAGEEKAAGSLSAQNTSMPAAHTLKTDTGKTLEGYYPEDRKIIISDADMAGWITEIAEHIRQYTGWTISMQGQVVMDPAIFEAGTFSPARQLMTCCVADLSVIGLTCLYDVKGPLRTLVRPGEWIHVTGTLKQGTFRGEPEPQVQCISAEETQPPADPYVYP